MAEAREWLAGTRPRTLPAAVVPVLIGSGVAFGYDRFSWWRALLALVVALALQVYAAMATSASTGAARDITLIAHPDSPGQVSSR